MKRQSFGAYGDHEKCKAYLNSGHEWEEDEGGVVDIFAADLSDPHNGPKCVNCGYSPCWHCDPIPRPCTATKKSKNR